ncbi:helix-turn-helix domain-containing protein [Streptomyces sp. NPDC087440]|uniref:helix-turn-helix domain-containing protein n=1 Tax=Streptomyces sp. NPDC087440 TaxID=3365790 RepID=UPI0037F96600
MPAERFRDDVPGAQSYRGAGGDGAWQGKSEAAARVLGEHLRQLRKERRLGLKDVAPVIRGSVSKVSRLERGESPPKEQDVRDLMKFYRLSPMEEFEIESLLRHTRESHWWSQYADVTPGYLRRLIGLEGAAERIFMYENHIIPGLLQTRDYARAVVRAAVPSATLLEVERRVDLRIHRQHILQGTQSPTMVVLLDESVLWRQFGGAQVMLDQLLHLKRVGNGSGMNIRIVRFADKEGDVGVSIAPSYPITHLKFHDGGPAELVYVELLDSALYLSKPPQVDLYRHVLNELSFAAAPRRVSARMLDDAIARQRSRLEAAGRVVADEDRP